MSTGFEKFKEKTLSESGITIDKPKPVKEKAEEGKQIKKLAEAAGIKRRGRPRTMQSDENTFQMTIIIQMEQKRKLDKLKYIYQRSYKQLAEEAFEDLFRKYQE